MNQLTPFRSPNALFSAVIVAFASATTASAQMLMPTPELVKKQDCADCPPLIQLPTGLFMSRAPVTRGAFAVFAEATGQKRTGWGCNWNYPAIDQDESHPVVCITYQDAEAYVSWLSATTKKSYRLPTVAEMRFAALAAGTDNYWWGRTVGKNRANCVACKSPFDGKGTSPVGSFEENPFGLQDAVGNVWVWTSDCLTTQCDEHMLVGGSWSSPPGDLRVTKVISNKNDIPFNTYGLRVVRDE
jgi:formylglycine-generating enzyme required for sulfatase activity